MIIVLNKRKTPIVFGVKRSKVKVRGAKSLSYNHTITYLVSIIEPRHEKTNNVRLRPAWIQMSLRIRAVSSGSMLINHL